MEYSTPVLDTPSKAPDSSGSPLVHSVPPVNGPQRSPKRRKVVRRPVGLDGHFRRSPLAYVSLVVLGLIILGAIFAPLLSPFSKDNIDLSRQYLSPSLDHPFGTDDLGRDMFVRVMHGGRVSLLVGFLAMLVALVLGLVAGGLAGYYGGHVDTVIMRFVDLMLALPVFFVILFMSSIITPRMTVITLCVMIGFSQWMEVARLVRAVIISTKQHEFVDAARILGYTDRRIILRHLLPHTLAPVLVAVTLGIAQAIVIESALSFLGFGVQPPTPSWGAMLQNAQGYLGTCPWIAVFPGLMIFTTVVCCNVLADFLGDVYNPAGSKNS